MEGIQTYVTFRFLGGSPVTYEQIAAEIARWPLDGILGCLGALSLAAVKAGQEFSNPRLQGHYLNRAIVDDFPSLLPNAGTMYNPGHVPHTGGVHTLVHEHNLTWLAHEALLGASEGSTTPELSYELQCRVCRLLLLSNDLFGDAHTPPVPSSLSERQEFVIYWLRHGQFNKSFELSEVTILKIARQYILMLEILPKYFPSVESAFLDATDGVSLQKYFEILLLFVCHIHHVMTPENRWLSKDGLCAAVRAHRDEVERLIGRWICTPEEYRNAWHEWRRCRPASGYQLYYDFVPLREKPLIEARPGDLICPVLPFLFAKIVDEPYFILSDFLENQQAFQQAFGKAYEEYANRLVKRIGDADRGGQWQVRHGPRTHQGAELSDSYLQRGNIGIAFEHKGLRPGTDFLRGGEGERVIGPSQAVVTRLEQQQPVSLRKGRAEDQGLFTRGMWQQSIAGQSLSDWAEREIGIKPQRIFSIITYLTDLRIDKVTWRAYLNPLMVQAHLYQQSFWERPQWLHISDLEALAALAERGKLDLEAVLHEKSTRWEDKQFDIFLYELCERLHSNPVDLTLHNKGEALLRSAGASFWLEEFSEG
jgi:hypothetical protein